MRIDSKPYLVQPNSSFDLKEWHTKLDLEDRSVSKLQIAQRLARKIRRIQKLQKLLFAESQQALLIILQGMDTSGKDSTIKHICTGINPQGLRVYGFGVPTTTEYQFTFLHRFWGKFPALGFIHVFNRSYYEEVTVVRVHPELLENRNLRRVEASSMYWQHRLEDINALEAHLSRNGTRIVKIFLHISKEEQRERLASRLRDPQKHWKFDPSDIRERRHWEEYQETYSSAISATTSKVAPWWVLPADQKPIARLLVADLIFETLANMAPSIDELPEKQIEMIESYRKIVSEPK